VAKTCNFPSRALRLNGDYNPGVQIGQPAPDFSLPDLSGTLHRLSDQRGKIVVVNFWSAECPWVERADRELLACLGEHGERLVLLTIAANANENDELCAAAARTRALPLVLRGSLQVQDAYEAHTTPHIFIVDEHGILRYRGALDDVTFRQREAQRHYVREALEALQSGRSPAPAETVPYGCAIVRFVLE
jgi:thiol-disulfide isomerase/thioredoxin